MNSKKDIFFIEAKSGLLELDIVWISDWEGFDKLVSFLHKYYQASIIKKFDGIGSRRYQLRVGNDLLELTYDDLYGNSMKSLTSQGNIILKKIGEDLRQRLTSF